MQDEAKAKQQEQLKKEIIKMELDKKILEMYKIYKNANTILKKLTDLEDGYEFKIMSYKRVEKTNGFLLICYADEKFEYFKIWSNVNITKYLEKILIAPENSNKFVNYKDIGIFVYENDLKYIIHIKKLCNKWSNGRNISADVNIKCNNLIYKKKEEIQEPENKISGKIDEIMNFKNYNKLEKMKF